MKDIFVERKERVKQSILEKPNVVGVGVGFKNNVPGQKAIVVMVEKKKPLAALSEADLIPRAFGAVKTDVIETGEIKAGFAHKASIPYDLKRTDRWRPAPGGVSIGHYKVTAGTLGTVVYSTYSDGTRYLLSNNHVFANSNDAELGDVILQPGAHDGGIIEDHIAVLHRFAPINFGEEPGSCSIAEYYARFGNFLAEKVGSKHRVNSIRRDKSYTSINHFDAAIAKPYKSEDIDPSIIGIGEVYTTEQAYLGQRVVKSGRTTEYTEGYISLIHTTVKVNYGSGKIATFDDQLVAGPMSAGGDSGSLVVSGDTTNAVGLLFAGSTQTTIFSPIEPILDYFNVRFMEKR